MWRGEMLFFWSTSQKTRLFNLFVPNSLKKVFNKTQFLLSSKEWATPLGNMDYILTVLKFVFSRFVINSRLVATGRHISGPYSKTAVGSNGTIIFLIIHVFCLFIKVSSVVAFLAEDLSTFIGNKSTSKGHHRRDESKYFVFNIKLRCSKRLKKFCACIWILTIFNLKLPSPNLPIVISEKKTENIYLLS